MGIWKVINDRPLTIDCKVEKPCTCEHHKSSRTKQDPLSVSTTALIGKHRNKGKKKKKKDEG